jgi:GH25 family lysozyme M1 (1,4-beta-N-acetylmuramidase)
MRINKPGLLFISVLLIASAQMCAGQYPTIAADVATESQQKNKAAQQRSDQAWEKASMAWSLQHYTFHGVLPGLTKTFFGNIDC